MSEFSPHAGRWIARLQQLSLQVRAEPDPQRRDRLLGETWELVHTALTRFLRIHEHHCGGLSPEERQDMAAEKALDLMRRIERGQWDMSGYTPGEIYAYLSRTAHNLVMDFGRAQGRSARFVRASEPSGRMAGDRLIEPGSVRPEGAAPAPQADLESREYVRCLMACVEALNPRTRLAWFLRAFYGMASRDIATHPAIDARPGTVDLLVHRGRAALSACMKRKGIDPVDMPPGTFVRLWDFFQSLRMRGGEPAHEP